MREALQPIFDLKARLEPPLRFYEAMRLLGVDELMPEMLKDARVRQVLQQVSNTNWKRWGTVAVIIGGFASLAMVGDFAISVYLLVHLH